MAFPGMLKQIKVTQYSYTPDHNIIAIVYTIIIIQSSEKPDINYRRNSYLV